jgi:hypothetical protein
MQQTIVVDLLNNFGRIICSEIEYWGATFTVEANSVTVRKDGDSKQPISLTEMAHGVDVKIARCLITRKNGDFWETFNTYEIMDYNLNDYEEGYWEILDYLDNTNLLVLRKDGRLEMIGVNDGHPYR